MHSSPAGLCLPPTSIVSPLFSDSLVFIFSKRTNDRTSITGSTGASPSGSGLHRLAYRRKRNRLTPRSELLWDTAAAAATAPAVAACGRTPCFWPCRALPPAYLRKPRPRGWPIAPLTFEGASRRTRLREINPSNLRTCARVQAFENRSRLPRSTLLLLLRSLSAHHSTSPGSMQLQNHVWLIAVKLSLGWPHPLFLQHRDSSLPAPPPMFQECPLRHERTRLGCERFWRWRRGRCVAGLAYRRKCHLATGAVFGGDGSNNQERELAAL